MKCQICHKRVATIHLTEIENGVNREIHLCEECYKKEQQNVLMSAASSLEEVMGQMMETIKKEEGEGEDAGGKVCPVCGTSYADFQKSGLFGCPRDYTVFKDEVYPLLEKIHGSTTHAGKTPRTALKVRTQAEQLIILRQELDKAIKDEMYERAARIRDEIARREAN